MEAGKVSGVVTEKGAIRTQAVLCAGGAWSSLFCRRHGLRLGERVPQHVARPIVVGNGECGPRQVPDARIAVASGTGGWFCSSGTVVLGRD